MKSCDSWNMIYLIKRIYAKNVSTTDLDMKIEIIVTLSRELNAFSTVNL